MVSRWALVTGTVTSSTSSRLSWRMIKLRCAGWAISCTASRTSETSRVALSADSSYRIWIIAIDTGWITGICKRMSEVAARAERAIRNSNVSAYLAISRAIYTLKASGESTCRAWINTMLRIFLSTAYDLKMSSFTSITFIILSSWTSRTIWMAGFTNPTIFEVVASMIYTVLHAFMRHTLYR